MRSSELETRYRSRPFVGTSLDPARGPSISDMRWLATFQDVVEALRSPAFEQGGGGRRDSAAVVGDSLLSLSGSDHFERRRFEAPLFARRHLARLEREIFLPRLMRELDNCEDDGDGWRRGDARQIVRAALLGVSAALVGLSLAPTREAETRLLALMDDLAAGVNAEWIDRDHRTVIETARSAMAKFAAEFFAPAWAERTRLLEEVRLGRRGAGDLPNDLITVMLANEEHFGRWDPELPVREAVLVNGAPSSIPLFVGHALEDLLTWAGADEARGRRLVDPQFLRSACHELLRIHPATPFLIRRAKSDVTMTSGTVLRAGEYVVVDLLQANRDPSIFREPDGFDPERMPASGVRPGLLAFGTGPHTCIGMAMSIGEPRSTEDGPRGLMVLALQAFFERRVSRDQGRQARLDAANVRGEYTSYPVRFTAATPTGEGGMP